MKDKKIKSEINKYCQKWMTNLCLNDWAIKVEFEHGNHSISAECYPQWEYMQVKIVFYIDQINSVENPYIEALVVHELMHVILDQLNEKSTEGNVNKHEERVATMLEHAFLKMGDKKK